MKKLSLTLIALLSSATVFAKTEPVGRDIVANTDPAKVAEVERHAQELKDKQEAAINSAAPTAAGTKHKKAKPQHKTTAPKGDMGQPEKPDAVMPSTPSQ